MEQSVRNPAEGILESEFISGAPCKSEPLSEVSPCLKSCIIFSVNLSPRIIVANGLAAPCGDGTI